MHYELASRVILWQSVIYWGEIIRDLRDQNCPDFTNDQYSQVQDLYQDLYAQVLNKDQ